MLHKIKRKIMEIFHVLPAYDRELTVREELTHRNNVLKNQLWYRGNACELEQFFSGIGKRNKAAAGRFWAASANSDVRKIHSGIVAEVIDFYAQMTAADCEGIKVNNDDYNDELKKILKDNKFRQLIADCTAQTLITGDGAFKISVDTELTAYPIIEFYGADRVDYEYTRGRLKEVIFYTHYIKENTDFCLAEYYGKGYIKYKLFRNDKETELTEIPETAALENIEFEKELMLAVPVRFFKSCMYFGRGKALFENKTEDLDGLDEVLSQWMDAIRDGRVTKYIPESMIPRDEENGVLQKPNSFVHRFVKVNGTMSETAADTITTSQPTINYEAYLNSFISFLDLVLQGIISPSSLGIDTKKTDNAEAQREKEKTTLTMRSIIVDTLKDDIAEVCRIALAVYGKIRNDHNAVLNANELEITVKYGEYASPSFDSRITAVGEGYQKGVLSTEKAVDELWGDSMSEDDKIAEVARIKAERETTLPEPLINAEQ